MSTRFRALQHRNFQLFFGGQLVSLIGTWMQSTAQLWLIYRMTHSASLLGLFGFANQIPILLLAPLGGYTGDRYSRHRGVIWTQTSAMILAFLLAGLTLAHAIRVWEIIAIGFLAGIVNAFDIPIRQSFIVQMVGREHLANAIALNSSIFNGARIVGPAIAGFAIAAVGEGWCFFGNGISFLAVIGALLAMQIAPVETRPPEGSVLRNFVQGFRFAVNDMPIRSALMLLSMLSLLGLQYSVFLPIFGNEVVHGGQRIIVPLMNWAKSFAGSGITLEAGPLRMGLLMSAAGVGAVAGALHFAARTTYKGLARWIAATSSTAALALILFSQSRMFWLSAVALLFVGFAATVQMAATNTLVQHRVPDALRGRVMAVYATVFMGVQPLGSLLAGGVAKRIGAPITLSIFGTACFLGAMLFIIRVLMPIEQQRRATERGVESVPWWPWS
ncbi:MAG: MFS transporter [Candidatus Acidiferrales bacterium]|jgi:MFS family permease